MNNGFSWPTVNLVRQAYRAARIGAGIDLILQLIKITVYLFKLKETPSLFFLILFTCNLGTATVLLLPPKR